MREEENHINNQTKDEGLSSLIEPLGLDVSPYSLFVGSIRSPETKEKYLQRMGYFFDYLEIDQSNPEECFKILTQKAMDDCNWIANLIFKYLRHHKGRVERKEISSATLLNYIKPIRLYCEQMDIPIPWKKIMRGMPKGRRYANDRAPTLDEIKKVLAYPDRRIRPIIFTMTSSAIRLSAWNYLKWKHIVPILRDNEIIAAKIIVYADDDEEYFSFISREAYDSLNEWIMYRKQSGETVTGRKLGNEKLVGRDYSKRERSRNDSQEIEGDRVKEIDGKGTLGTGYQDEIDRG